MNPTEIPLDALEATLHVPTNGDDWSIDLTITDRDILRDLTRHIVQTLSAMPRQRIAVRAGSMTDPASYAQALDDLTEAIAPMLTLRIDPATADNLADELDCLQPGPDTCRRDGCDYWAAGNFDGLCAGHAAAAEALDGRCTA